VFYGVSHPITDPSRSFPERVIISYRRPITRTNRCSTTNLKDRATHDHPRSRLIREGAPRHRAGPRAGAERDSTCFRYLCTRERELLVLSPFSFVAIDEGIWGGRRQGQRALLSLFAENPPTPAIRALWPASVAVAVRATDTPALDWSGAAASMRVARRFGAECGWGRNWPGRDAQCRQVRRDARVARGHVWLPSGDAGVARPPFFSVVSRRAMCTDGW
jgi:hypothetical protein